VHIQGHQNPDKFQFKFFAILPSPEIVVGVRESLMLLVNSHILKMVAMLKPNAEYNRRVIEVRLATEIIRFFGYPRSTVYDVVAKYTLEQSNEDFDYERERVTRKNAPRGLSQLLKGLKR